jgi:hypothetical protein
MAESFGNWIDDAAWDTCLLGGVFLPGVVTISDFEYGQDIDVQKRRKKEKARLRDNGMAPCGFFIIVELTAADWPKWVEVLPFIQPRRTGAIRTPLKIVAPIPNVSGVEDVYVHRIKYEPASARRGLVVHIKVAEWFEEETETKTSKTSADGAHKRLDPNSNSDGRPADSVDSNGNYGVRNTDKYGQNMLDNSFKLNP